jgi:hypothetical protein
LEVVEDVTDREIMFTYDPERANHSVLQNRRSASI